MTYIKSIAIAAIVFCVGGCTTFPLRGQQKTCIGVSEIDQALSVGNNKYFSGWKDKDYDDAIAWASACRNDGWQFARATRVERLSMLKISLHEDERQRAAEAEKFRAFQEERDARNTKELAKETDRDQKRKVDAEAKDRLLRCKSSNLGRLYQAQEDVIETVSQLAGWRENQSKERRYAAASGVRNLREERNNGEWIVTLSDDLRSYFSEYKRLGGKAKNPQTVTHSIADPCA